MSRKPPKKTRPTSKKKVAKKKVTKKEVVRKAATKGASSVEEPPKLGSINNARVASADDKPEETKKERLLREKKERQEEHQKGIDERRERKEKERRDEERAKKRKVEAAELEAKRAKADEKVRPAEAASGQASGEPMRVSISTRQSTMLVGLRGGYLALMQQRFDAARKPFLAHYARIDAEVRAAYQAKPEEPALTSARALYEDCMNDVLTDVEGRAPGGYIAHQVEEQDEEVVCIQSKVPRTPERWAVTERFAG